MSRSRSQRFLLICWFAASAALSTVWADPAPSVTGQPKTAQPTERPQFWVRVPISPVPNGHGGPLLHVRINGTEDGIFLVDTSSGGCIITQLLVDSLGLKASPALNSDGTPFAPFAKPLKAVFPASLVIDGPPGYRGVTLNLVGIPFGIVMPSELGLPVDGIIGINALSRSALLFDFPAGTMDLMSPGNLSPALVRDCGFDKPGGAALPLSLSAGAYYSVPVVLVHL
jgi:hypothetical protein